MKSRFQIVGFPGKNKAVGKKKPRSWKMNVPKLQINF
jgi:hypothetical protein